MARVGGTRLVKYDHGIGDDNCDDNSHDGSGHNIWFLCFSIGFGNPYFTQMCWCLCRVLFDNHTLWLHFASPSHYSMIWNGLDQIHPSSHLSDFNDSKDLPVTDKSFHQPQNLMHFPVNNISKMSLKSWILSADHFLLHIFCRIIKVSLYI